MNPAFHPNRSRRLIAAAVAAVLALTALTGCVPKTPPLDPDTSTWFPLPTLPTGASTWYPPGWSSTPPTPGLPTSTADPLYQEAVQVYRVFYREYTDVRKAGGAETLPPALADVLTGQALAVISKSEADQLARGIHFVGTPRLELVSTRPYTIRPPDGALVGIETCEESDATIVDAAGQETIMSGHVWFDYQAFFQRDADQKLVMFIIQGGKVDSCPA